MEKRFILFILTSTLIIAAYAAVRHYVFPPPARPVAELRGEPDRGDDDDTGDLVAPRGDAPEPPEIDAPPDTTPDVAPGPASALPSTAAAARWVTLGSLDGESNYRLLVTLSSQGGAIERVEMSGGRFHELEFYGGYIGHLAPITPETGGGCIIQVVGPGTPAARARPLRSGVEPGLKPGDRVLSVGGIAVTDEYHFRRLVYASRAGDTLELRVQRPAEAGSPRMDFSVDVIRPPLQLIKPEYAVDPKGNHSLRALALPQRGERHPLSMLTTLERVGGKAVEFGSDELRGIPSLRESHWQLLESDDPDEVAFEFILGEDALAPLGESGAIRLVKRYRLEPARSANERPEAGGNPAAGYHLVYRLEIYNLDTAPKMLAFRQDGPTGLPLEGWWFSYKVHPKMFHGAGVRDVMYKANPGAFQLYGAGKISDAARSTPEAPLTPLFATDDRRPMRFVGVDTQYFAAALLPSPGDDPQQHVYQAAYALPAAEIDPIKKPRTDVTFRLISIAESVEPNPGRDPEKALVREYLLFAGPKDPAILAEYGLDDAIVYGWFKWVAVPMLWILHAFHSLVFNFGLAIIMLTVLVRGCMFPLSRKQALSAQKMQELAPEMKRIAEKYKNDAEKRTKAQQELFRKHNYNPLGGCLLVFLQLPIFIGLYRSLSVDIHLREAALIPGLPWCANLAAPDQLWYWEPYFFQLLVGGDGYLGPYLNILPIVTVALFLVQQKMFMPPPTDEQQKMQQQMMTFMMLFIGLLFFRVASGLCVYFIASSLWGLAERKLLPKPKKPAAGDEAAAEKNEAAAAEAARARRRRQRRR